MRGRVREFVPGDKPRENFSVTFDICLPYLPDSLWEDDYVENKTRLYKNLID